VAASPAAAAVGQHKTEEGSPTLSSPGLATSPARGLTVPLVKVEQHNNVGVAAHPGGANNGAFARAQHHPASPTGAVIGTIKVPGPMPVAGPTNSNEGFEFNENDSAAPHSSAVAVLSKRRRSMDASFEAAGGHLLGRPPVRDQALRKRRKSVIDRTTTGSVRSEETTTAPAPRDMRKRKASLPPSTAPNPNGAGLGDDGSLSPKKTKFDDEDYIDTGRESGGGDKDKEGQRDVADSATPIRGIRGRGRGRGMRGMKARGGRGGRSGGNSSAHNEKDLDGVPKTKYGSHLLLRARACRVCRVTCGGANLVLALLVCDSTGRGSRRVVTGARTRRSFGWAARLLPRTSTVAAASSDTSASTTMTSGTAFLFFFIYFYPLLFYLGPFSY
jgi:hypothetical protein